ncbi:MAG: DEAD/DEAH box helicase family protein, partial [Methanomicrobiales archaeon]|nr:DEAD/DEAH box helicase family protein [Methanomicrobiales archaeon]
MPDSVASFSFDEYRVPFLYSSNGTINWFIDVRNEQNRSHEVKRFHTPQALQERLSLDFDVVCQKLLSTPNNHPRLRPYQVQANHAVETAIAERKQKMLVAMATGTGKWNLPAISYPI